MSNGGGGEVDNHGGDEHRHYDNEGGADTQQPQYYEGEMDGGEDMEGGDGQQPQYEDHYEDDGNGGFSVTKRLVGSRIARKQAEDDVKLLANRIALLKMEEQKVCI